MFIFQQNTSRCLDVFLGISLGTLVSHGTFVDGVTLDFLVIMHPLRVAEYFWFLFCYVFWGSVVLLLGVSSLIVHLITVSKCHCVVSYLLFIVSTFTHLIVMALIALY